jgi:hypothetical protein
MQTHPRYAGVPAHLVPAAMRDDLERLTASDQVALSHWLGERLGPLLPAPLQPAFEVVHVMRETVQGRGIGAKKPSDA